MPDIWLSRHASGLSWNQRPFTAGPCSRFNRPAIRTEWPYPECLAGVPGREVAQADYSDGSMLALCPPAGLARKLALPDGLADDPHVTVCYTGNAADMSSRKLPGMS
jgi:hypothetical protein